MAVSETFARWIGSFSATKEGVAQVHTEQATTEALLSSCEYELGQMRRTVQTVLLEMRLRKTAAAVEPKIAFRLDEKLRSPTRRVA